MRVLYLNPFSQAISGADESLIDLLAAIVPLGVEAHVVLPGPSPLEPRYVAAGAAVHHAPLSALSRSLRPWTLVGYGLRLLRGARAVARLARELKVDLIHTNMEVVLDGGIAARLLRLPHVLHYRGNTRDDPKLVFDVLARVWAGLSDRILCISHLTNDIFVRRGLGARAEALYDPVPVGRYAAARRSDSVRAGLGAGRDDVLVGTVARIHPRKDLLTFVEACRRVAAAVPAARFVIVGAAHEPLEHAYEASVRAAAHEAGLGERLTFAGARSDMPEVMNALDVFVLCSRHEGFGRVVPEAMAASVPCVLTDEGALRELSRDGDLALLAPPADAGAFAAAIQRLASEPDLRASLGRRAKAEVGQFEPASVAREVLGRYERLVRDRDRAPPSRADGTAG